MTETQPTPVGRTAASGRSWKRWLAYTSIVVAVVIVGGWIGAAFVPRWWSQRVADQVEGSIWSGSSLGVFYGFVFTFLPLLVIAWAIRKRRSWKAWLAFAALAIVLALPNLFTLGIVLGSGNAAHAASARSTSRLPASAAGPRSGRSSPCSRSASCGGSSARGGTPVVSSSGCGPRRASARSRLPVRPPPTTPD